MPLEVVGRATVEHDRKETGAVMVFGELSIMTAIAQNVFSSPIRASNG
jgi:hypothetical protein